MIPFCDEISLVCRSHRQARYGTKDPDLQFHLFG